MAKKRYGTLDEALTAGTGMNADQRQAFRDRLDELLDQRKKFDEGTPERAALDREIMAAMRGG